MNVTILSENTKLNKSKLNTEHGLSILIEKDDKKLLFDTGGPEGTIIQNARTLNLDLSQVDAVVISHGHDDHSGGLLDFFKLNDHAPVYMKKQALNPHYTTNGSHKEFIGLDNKIIEDYNERIRFVTETSEILEGVSVVSDIYKKFSTPTTNQILFSKEGDQVITDNFDHELFMTVIDNNNELTVFSGCGHTGIMNMVITAEELYPTATVKTIIGGFHFQAGKISSVTANSEEIECTSRLIKSKAVEKVYTGHCTGVYGYEIMKSILKSNIEQFYTGKKIII